MKIQIRKIVIQASIIPMEVELWSTFKMKHVAPLDTLGLTIILRYSDVLQEFWEEPILTSNAWLCLVVLYWHASSDLDSVNHEFVDGYVSMFLLLSLTGYWKYCLEKYDISCNQHHHHNANTIKLNRIGYNLDSFNMNMNEDPYLTLEYCSFEFQTWNMTDYYTITYCKLGGL